MLDLRSRLEVSALDDVRTTPLESDFVVLR
jgi:hypothetical protein